MPQNKNENKAGDFIFDYLLMPFYCLIGVMGLFSDKDFWSRFFDISMIILFIIWFIFLIKDILRRKKLNRILEEK